MQKNHPGRTAIGSAIVLITLATTVAATAFAQDATIIVVDDTAALYETWAGEDGTLTVNEWDAAVDEIFGEQDVNLEAADWDDDGDGVISPVEFEEAITEEALFDTPKD